MVEEFEQEHRWCIKHHKELEEKFSGKFIAVLNKNVVSVGRNYRDANRKARDKFPKSIALITYVPKKGEETLLV